MKAFLVRFACILAFCVVFSMQTAKAEPDYCYIACVPWDGEVGTSYYEVYFDCDGNPLYSVQVEFCTPRP